MFFDHFLKLYLYRTIFPILTFSIDLDDLYAVRRVLFIKKTRRRGEMSRNLKVYFCRTNATE